MTNSGSHFSHFFLVFRRNLKSRALLIILFCKSLFAQECKGLVLKELGLKYMYVYVKVGLKKY